MVDRYCILSLKKRSLGQRRKVRSGLVDKRLNACRNCLLHVVWNHLFGAPIEDAARRVTRIWADLKTTNETLPQISTHNAVEFVVRSEARHRGLA
jgi:hypothetical protein